MSYHIVYYEIILIFTNIWKKYLSKNVCPVEEITIIQVS